MFWAILIGAECGVVVVQVDVAVARSMDGGVSTFAVVPFWMLAVPYASTSQSTF